MSHYDANPLDYDRLLNRRVCPVVSLLRAIYQVSLAILMGSALLPCSAQSQETPAHRLVLQSDIIDALSFSPTGTYLAVAGRKEGVLWDLRTKERYPLPIGDYTWDSQG